MEALGINLPGLLAQLVNFILLLVLLRIVLYQPVMRMLDERAARVRQSMEQAELIRRQAEQIQQEFQARIDQARREGQQIIAEAHRAAEQVRQQKLQEALGEAEALLARARAEIERERDAAIAQLRREFADLTVLATERVIGRVLDRDDHRRLIEEVLAEVERTGGTR
ncbi:MAG: ATP synthase F0 subunit B [Chloroflexota bacterium]